jgi:hypothetical protein
MALVAYILIPLPKTEPPKPSFRSQFSPNNSYVRKMREKCRLAAHLHTKELGANTYRYAEAVSYNRALLHFRHPKSGRTWTTNYYCD